ncbi:MAG: twin-arginine translocase TatA/TatE family subunit [Flavobacteriales bacterium]|nr:twin-arginine translocase TatA/TatE family subunit [Flavobacteriales bacterium]
MGTTEIIFIFVIYLLLFGSKGIPSLAKTMGEGVRHFRSATDEIQREILKGTDLRSNPQSKDSNNKPDKMETESDS